MITEWVIGAAFLAFLFRRLLTYLHIYQQDEYDSSRFFFWLFRTAAFDRKVTAGLLLLSLLPLWPWGIFGTIAALVIGTALEQNPCKLGKKPLVLTVRAKRILALSLCLGALATVVTLQFWTLPPWGWAIAVQAIPFLLTIANTALKPLEWFIQRRYWIEAHNRLLTINPVVIGVTGSFGKTSVKQLLGYVLQTHAQTYFTKGSINTQMGVSRAIREKMPEDCHYYIGEMGAYGIGSIDRLCRLTPPHYGIITAVGEAHYERFKSLENVAKAKFELAEAVMAHQGKIVITEEALAQPYALRFVQAHRTSFIVCGESVDADVKIAEAKQTEKGTSINVLWQNQAYQIQAPIWGHHQAGNMALVFALCVNLGISPEQVVAALKTAPQAKHRLEVKRQPDGTLYIDDAYNSNPVGFANALDTLALLCPKGGRRILVTPGMVELGSEHDAQHTSLARKALECVDVALVVQPERIPTFVATLAEKLGKNLMTFPNFAKAQEWLKDNVKPHDSILLENDLPDLYEKKLSL